MAARYCKVCNKVLTIGDQRMKRTAHYHCGEPPPIPYPKCDWCGEPSQVGIIVEGKERICERCYVSTKGVV